MTETNDIELADKAQEVINFSRHLNETMAAGRLHAVVDLAAKIEDAARKLGWRAWDLKAQKKERQ